MMKWFIVLGGVNAFLAVALGAFGAHALNDKLTESGYMQTYETAVQYHMFHALGLLAVGLLAKLMPSGGLFASGWLLFFGILLFSGSLYVLSLTEIRWLGAITPLGGLCFLLGWLMLVITGLSSF